MNIVVTDLLELGLERPEIQSVTVSVTVDDESLTVDLKDGRAIITPLLWYPRLDYATEQERQNFQILRNVIILAGAGRRSEWARNVARAYVW